MPKHGACERRWRSARLAVQSHAARALVLGALLLSGCSDSDAQVPASPPDYSAPGEYGVGHQTLSLTHPDGRSIQVELWYPADQSAVGPEPTESYVAEPERAAFRALLDQAPRGCPTEFLAAERGAAPAAGSLPLVVYSHCVSCINLSGASLAIRLASHGIAVAAPNHAGPLPFADGAEGEPLDAAQLALREGDLSLVLDSLLGAGDALPDEMRGRFDPERVAAMGHSFGSVSVGKLTQADPRIRAVFGLAAPMENPLLPGVDVAALSVPVGLLIAQEDNSIQEIGNSFIRQNFDEVSAGGVEVTLLDAGHWSMSDLCGLVSAFTPGCGSGVRHSEGQQGNTFDYLPVPSGIAISQSYTTAFFRAHLLGEAEALAFLAEEHPLGAVTLRTK